MENPQASGQNDTGWPWAGHFTSLGLSFLICKVGSCHLPPLWVETIPVKPRSYSPTHVSLSSFPGSPHQMESDQLTTDYCTGPGEGWGLGGPSHPSCSFKCIHLSFLQPCSLLSALRFLQNVISSLIPLSKAVPPLHSLSHCPNCLNKTLFLNILDLQKRFKDNRGSFFTPSTQLPLMLAT